MAYTVGNKCAKNLCKRIVLLQLIIENVVTCFFGTQCIISYQHIEDQKTTSFHYQLYAETHRFSRQNRCVSV